MTPTTPEQARKIAAYPITDWLSSSALNSLADQVEALTKERDALMAAAKLAWVAIVELRYSNSTDKSRSVSEFAVQAMRQAGIK